MVLETAGVADVDHVGRERVCVMGDLAACFVSTSQSSFSRISGVSAVASPFAVHSQVSRACEDPSIDSVVLAFVVLGIVARATPLIGAVYTPACVCSGKSVSFVTLNVGRIGHRLSDVTKRLTGFLCSLVSLLSTPQLVFGNFPVSLLASRRSADSLLAIHRELESCSINKGVAAPYSIGNCALN